MKVLLTLILASGIYCRNLDGINQRQQQELLKLSEELQESNTVLRGKENYGSYISEENTDKKLNTDLIEKLHQFYLLIERRMNVNPDLKLSQLDKAVYSFIKTMKQRNKRQNTTKYITLCHFKICNISGKRRARYVHMAKSTYDDRDT